MKKTILLFLILLCVGCSTKLFQLKKEYILDIHYDTLDISPHNYSEIAKLLNKMNFTKREMKGDYEHTLTLTTKKDLYYVMFSTDKKKLKIKTNDQYYYASNKYVQKLQNYLDQLPHLYEDDSFYKIELTTDFSQDDQTELIKVEDSDKYIKLTFHKFVTNFSVHAGTWEKEKFQDQRLIYHNGYLKENSTIYIQKRLNYENIRISFENQYHTAFSIIPMIDENQNKMIFKTEKTTQ